jgi:hypothetical protein
MVFLYTVKGLHSWLYELRNNVLVLSPMLESEEDNMIEVLTEEDGGPRES